MNDSKIDLHLGKQILDIPFDKIYIGMKVVRYRENFKNQGECHGKVVLKKCITEAWNQLIIEIDNAGFLILILNHSAMNPEIEHWYFEE